MAVQVYVLSHSNKVLGVYTGQAKAKLDAECCNEGELNWNEDRSNPFGSMILVAEGSESAYRDTYRIEETRMVA